jgi:hypothetical protein
MRKIALIFAIIIMTPEIKGQVSDTIKIAKEYELEVMRYHIGRYYHERQNALYISFLSIGFSSVSLITDDIKQKEVMLTAAVATGLISFILGIDAEKWLKRSSIKPATSGLGINYNFNKPKRREPLKSPIYDDLYK